MNKLTFNEVKEKNIQILKQYVPIVARVHGANHEEFYEVQKVFEVILEKLKNNKLDLNNEFSKLKEITNDYTVPKDVCESYEAVYNMLAELNNAYEGQ